MKKKKTKHNKYNRNTANKNTLNNNITNNTVTITAENFIGNVNGNGNGNGNDANKTSLNLSAVNDEYFQPFDEQEVWEKVIKYNNRYFYELFTDDNYSDDKHHTLSGIENINWSLVVDVGEEQEDKNIFNELLLKCKHKRVETVSEASSIDTFNNTINTLIARKNRNINSYRALWGKYSTIIKQTMNKLINETRKVPLLFILDLNEK
jgi:hypothetical protein